MQQSARIIVTALVALIVIVLAVGGLILNRGRSDAYRGVFLANGQVYFGKQEGRSWRSITLSDVYYFQIRPSSTSTLRLDDLSLIKLGNEVHGPEDEIEINWDQVLFVERLRNDSPVVEAIGNYRLKGDNQTR